MNDLMVTPAWLDKIYRDLHQRILTSSLHHGLMFNGATGIGKSLLAESLVSSLLCLQPTGSGPCGHCQSCMLRKAGSHPDVYIVQSEKQIGVDAIREVSGKLNQTAQISRNKVCVIFAAETMTESAANALLKTLEEPTHNTYLILVTHAQHKLLPTILSRCEKHRLPSPSVEESRRWLAQYAPELTVNNAMMDLYGEHPLRLKARLEENDIPDFDALMADLKAIQTGNKTAISVAKKWESDGASLVSWCQVRANHQFKQTLDSKDYERYQVCVSAKAKLDQQGINTALLLQQVIDAMADLA